MAKRTHANQFPGIYVPAEVLQLVESGLFEDTSWCNDVCASFEHRDTTRLEGLRLWVDHEMHWDREIPRAYRFTIDRMLTIEGDWVLDNTLMVSENIGPIISYIKNWIKGG